MAPTIYRAITPKRRTVRPKAKAAVTPFHGMLKRLGAASTALSASRRRR